MAEDAGGDHAAHNRAAHPHTGALGSGMGAQPCRAAHGRRWATHSAASAVLGTSFEAELVAQLLAEPLGLVLEKLQEATDAGVPLADRGASQLMWPATIVAALPQSTLPSPLRV